MPSPSVPTPHHHSLHFAHTATALWNSESLLHVLHPPVSPVFIPIPTLPTTSTMRHLSKRASNREFRITSSYLLSRTRLPPGRHLHQPPPQIAVVPETRGGRRDRGRFPQKQWPRVTLRRSSRKNVGWEWVRTEVYFCARHVLLTLYALSYPSKPSTTACIRRKPTRLSCLFIMSSPYLPVCVLPGHFAVKKIAVGESHSYLLKILREVCLFYRSPCMTITNLFLRFAS
jgi:hypothetical protein